MPKPPKKRKPRHPRVVRKTPATAPRPPRQEPAPSSEREQALAVSEAILALAPARGDGDAIRQGLAISVAAASMDDGLSLTHETRLVKAALLYADHVTLLSPRARLLEAAEVLQDLSFSDMMRLIQEWGHRTAGVVPGEVMVSLQRHGQVIRHLGDDRVLAALPPPQRQQIEEAMSGLADTRGQFNEVLANLFDEADAGELRVARRSGLLTIDDLRLRTSDEPYRRLLRGYDATISDGDPGGMVEALVTRVARLLDRGRSCPLFDDEMGSMVSNGLNEGVFVAGDSTKRRAAQAGLGTGFIERLPAFPAATVDEIIDVRSELGDPLVRFRAEVTRLSGEVAQHALNREFANHVDHSWRQNVEPALLEIRESIHDNKFLAVLQRHAVGGGSVGGTVVGGALGVVLGTGTAAGVAVAAGGLLAGAATSAWHASRDAQRERERGSFWFVYEADERLRQAAQ